MRTFDLWIEGGTIFTLDQKNTVYSEACVGIKDARIAYLGEKPQEGVSAKEVVNARSQWIFPGFINAHTHAAMVYFRGFADDLPLKEWLEQHIWPLERKWVTPDFIRNAVQLASLEMIRSGTTAFCDMYFFQDEAAEILQRIGIRAFLGEGVIDFPTPSAKTPEKGMLHTQQFIERWKNHPTIHPIVAPHAPYSCSEKTLKASRELADTYGVPLQIHLAEECWERENFLKEKGMTSVKYLQSIGFLGPGVSGAHANWLDADDIRILKEAGAGVAHNPESNMKLATGFCPVPELLKAGIKVGLGTDGAASNNDLDMVGEMRTAALLHKISHRDPTAVTAEQVVRMATIGSASILGKENELGSIEIGKFADLIILSPASPHLIPHYHPYSALVYSAKSTDVETVIVHGKILMKKRELLTMDEEKTLAEARLFQHSLSSTL